MIIQPAEPLILSYLDASDKIGGISIGLISTGNAGLVDVDGAGAYNKHKPCSEWLIDHA